MPSLIGTSRSARVTVYESSAAAGPYIWLALEQPDDPKPIHLSLVTAVQLAEQILWLADNHYQVRKD